MPADVRGPLRMSVLSAVLSLQEYCASTPGASLEQAAGAIQQGVAINARGDYRSAVIVASTVELPTPQGPDDRLPRLRLLLEQLIWQLQPRWGRLIPRGRRVVELALE